MTWPGGACVDEHVALAALVIGGHVEGDFPGGEDFVLAVDGEQPHAAAVQHQHLAAGRVGHVDAAGGAGVADGGVDVVGAAIELDVDDAAGRLAQQRQLAVGTGGVAEDAPPDAVAAAPVRRPSAAPRG